MKLASTTHLALLAALGLTVVGCGTLPAVARAVIPIMATTARVGRANMAHSSSVRGKRPSRSAGRAWVAERVRWPPER